MLDAPERFAEGAVVGHFRLEKTIGRGGMGVVWSASDERDGRRVALKFLDDVRRDDPVSHARFLREAEMASKLTHPNVVRVHAIDYTLAGTPFIVMDLLEGESLRARMKFAQRLSPRECGAVLGPVASVARVAHEAGIVHRDLKPENVFLSTAGVRVLDFGIAKRLDAGEVRDTFTSTGAMLGTPAYMAPEQIFGERDIDGKADVWALGVILYECLCGVRPVEGGVGQILKAVTSGHVVPLAERVPSPELAGLCRFVMTMLASESVRRPSMAEVERVLAGLGDDSAQVDASPAVARSATRGRRRSLVGLAATTMAFVLGFAGVRYFGGRHRSAEPAASFALDSDLAPSVAAPSAVASNARDAVPSAEPSTSPPLFVATNATNQAGAGRAPATSARGRTPQPRVAPTARAPEFDVVLGSVSGMGNQSTQSDVVGALRAMKTCLPSPTASERWTVDLAASWPKGGARTEAFTVRRNRTAVADAQATGIEACAKKSFDAATVVAPDGQDDVGGTSYVRMSAGYY